MIWKLVKNRVTGLRRSRNINYESYRDRGLKALRATRDPKVFPSFERHLRAELSLHQRQSVDAKTKQILHNEISATKRVKDLPLVFMFHGDGRVREEALNHLDGSLITPVNVFAMFSRLNDWSPAVRGAALYAAQRCLPKTPAVVIAPALKVLLPRIASWGRWSNTGREAVNALLMREDVAEILLRDVIGTRQPNLGVLLRSLFCNPSIDQHVVRIALDADLPHLRVLAVDALISQKMWWPTGDQQKVWDNRAFGKYRFEPTYHNRDLSVTVDISDVLRLAASDKANIVRRRAADGLIAFRNHSALDAHLADIALVLKDDKNFGVQERLEFLHRKCGEEGIHISAP
jgi:hypothetical protein